MKILALDTSSGVASVAVTDGDKLLGEYTLNHKKNHSQKLMPMLEELLSSLELGPGDMDLFAASSGPGSFTGLRIGVTAIKAIAYSVGKPVVSVPTLDALANNLPSSDLLACPMLDARNNQVYTALYRWEDQLWTKTTEYMGVSVDDLIQIIKEKGNKAIFLGDAVGLHREYIQKELQESCDFAPPSLILQRGASVAMLAYYKASMGLLENCFDMVPFYLRKSQAERELEKRGM